VSCGERSGFLFAHACDRPSTGACFSCGKPICVLHTRPARDDGSPLCVTCAAMQGPLDEDDPYRNSRSTYDSDDYRAFDDSDDTTSGDDYESDPSAS
jgi:hypothetical protein